jgi:hypothetical protein
MKIARLKLCPSLLALIVPALAASANLLAQSSQVTPAQPVTTGAAQVDEKLTSGQLQSLLAPIALYPDPLLAQVLAASTYPLETVEAAQWLKKNSSLQGSALVEAAAKKKWDPSIQALVVFPTTLQKMSENLDWTTAVGNAFLAQQEDVMNVIQALRQKAYASKTLASNSQQKVDVETQQGQSIVKIEPADPQVVYVPSYNPTVVYGPPPVEYPYPAMVYPPPPSTGAVIASSVISFGAGVALGAAFHDCCANGWGWNTNWGAHDVTINNTFVNRNNLNSTRNVSGTTAWAHNPANRGAVPYSNAAVAGRYGGTGAARSAYGSAGAARTATGAARSPYGSAGAARTTGPGAAGTGAAAARSGSAQRATGSAGGFEGARGGAGLNARSGDLGSADRSAFSTGRGGDWARSSSARGNSSLSSGGGGFRGGGGGGFRGGGGGGFRGGGGRGRR